MLGRLRLCLALAAVIAWITPAAAQLSFFDQPPAADASKGRQAVSVSPKLQPGSIFISMADRRLYHITQRGRAISYPITVPRDQDMWTGTEVVSNKRVNPPWLPTPTMLKENPRLPAYVPGGHPMNPMGARALYLGDTYYRIHGTDAPWLIGENISKGCIRMYNEHVIELFNATPLGTRVTVMEASISKAKPTRHAAY